MYLYDVKGAPSLIKMQSPDKPNDGLGFRHAPDGNQQHEFEFRKGKIVKMCKAAASMRLSQWEAETMLKPRLVPQTTYGMRLSQFTTKQCTDLDKIVNRTFLPVLKINRNSPRALVHGPLQYGGMEIPKHESLQDEWGLHFFIQSLRWSKTTANDIITVVDAYQLASGFVTPVLESPGLPIHHVGTGLIDHIRNRLRTLGGIIKLEDTWCPSLQRINDDLLLEMMCGARSLTKRDIKLANEFRLWARITTISDIAEEWGTEIPWERLNGD